MVSWATGHCYSQVQFSLTAGGPMASPPYTTFCDNLLCLFGFLVETMGRWGLKLYLITIVLLSDIGGLVETTCEQKLLERVVAILNLLEG